MSSKFEVVEGLKLRRKVRAVITNASGAFLLIQPLNYQDDTWSFVGGGIEEGESPEQAMARELSEEVGLKEIIEARASATRHKYEFSARRKQIAGDNCEGQIAFLFWVVVAEGAQIKLQTEEIRAFRWATAEEVSALVKVPAQVAWFEALREEFQGGARSPG